MHLHIEFWSLEEGRANDRLWSCEWESDKLDASLREVLEGNDWTDMEWEEEEPEQDENCPCFKVAQAQDGRIGPTNQHSCYSCRLAGGHSDTCECKGE